MKACRNGRTTAEEGFQRSGILATLPAAFAGCAAIVPSRLDERETQLAFTNQGLRINLPLSRDRERYAVLRCRQIDDLTELLTLPVRLIQGQVYIRDNKHHIESADRRAWFCWPQRTIYFMTSNLMKEVLNSSAIQRNSIVFKDLPTGVSINETYPNATSNAKNTVVIAGSSCTANPDEKLAFASIQIQPSVAGEGNPQNFVLAFHLLYVQNLDDEYRLIPTHYYLCVRSASTNFEDLTQTICKEVHVLSSSLIFNDRVISAQFYQQQILGN